MYQNTSNWKESINQDINKPKYIGDKKVDKIIVRNNIYNKEDYCFNEGFDVETLTLDPEKNQWIEVIGLHQEDIVIDLCKKFNIHPLTVEDILNMSQSPKVEEYDDYIFINTKNIIYNEEDGSIGSQQISMIFMKNLVISFKESDIPIFEGVYRKLNLKSPLREQGIDVLLYELLDSLVDRYFLVLDGLSERIDSVEDELLINPNKSLLHEIYNLKRTLIYMRKILWPMRNILNKLSQEAYYITNKTTYYFRDVYDHIIQMIDIVETYRDICSGMLDTYLSSIGNKTNDIMKVLTIFSTISVPLTFLTGVYGMNFANQPELHFKYGYHIFWISSLIITAAMLYYFRKKEWI